MLVSQSRLVRLCLTVREVAASFFGSIIRLLPRLKLTNIRNLIRPRALQYQPAYGPRPG